MGETLHGLQWADRIDLKRDGVSKVVRDRAGAFLETYFRYFQEGETIAFNSALLHGRRGLQTILHETYQLDGTFHMGYLDNGQMNIQIINNSPKAHDAANLILWRNGNWDLKFQYVYKPGSIDEVRISTSIFDNDSFHTHKISDEGKLEYALNFLHVVEQNMQEQLAQRSFINSIVPVMEEAAL